MSSIPRIKPIYMDNAAATPMNKTVQEEVARALMLYANPSSFNDQGRMARNELEKARHDIAKFLNARPGEVVFTSSGSEGNNMAIRGVAISGPKDKKEIMTTPIEHPSVLEAIRFLNKTHKSVFLKIDSAGSIDLRDIESKINTKTLLISVMYANNEIGTIEPIKTIAKIIKKFRDNKSAFPLFHVDACQAVEYLDMNVNNLGVDLLTFNGSKIYGPKGAGVLYIRKGVKVAPLILGGDQEGGLRAGTENLSAAVGLAKAVSLIDNKDSLRLAKLRDYFFAEVIKFLPDVKINGTMGEKRLPNNINISIPGLSSEALLLELDKYGIYAGSGSACTARSVEPSHVLKAINVPRKYLDGALRFSMGRQTSMSDVERIIQVLPKIVRDLRSRYNIK